MDDVRKIVNKNDNDALRKVTYNDPECIEYIPAANYLIKNFVKDEWKNHTQNYQYSYIEYFLCKYLSSKIFDRDTKIHFVSTILECSPLSLHNDPNLPI